MKEQCSEPALKGKMSNLNHKSKLKGKESKHLSKNHNRRKEHFQKEMKMSPKEAEGHAGVIDRLMKD